MKRQSLVWGLVLVLAGGLEAAPPNKTLSLSKSYSSKSGSETVWPFYLAELPNPNDFGLFADGGWDGNWYVGYNNCWISKLPPAPAGNYVKAFLGAKLGRAKNHPKPGRPTWEREAMPGEIFMAIASTPSWKHSVSLTTTDAIPFEPATEDAVLEVGQSQWFWKEIPLDWVSRQPQNAEPNYLALWSPTTSFVDAASSPILAAGWGEEGPVNTWLNKDVKGKPPQDLAKALSTGVSVFEPSLAIKLVPANDNKLEVRLKPLSAEPGSRMTLAASVEGTGVERVWLETQDGSKGWKRVGEIVWSAPYAFTVNSRDFKAGTLAFRAAAADVWENTAYSSPVIFKVAGK